jgi:iron complex outermembrane recepter protein
MLKTIVMLLVASICCQHVAAQTTTLTVKTNFLKKDSSNATVTITDVNDSTKVVTKETINNTAQFTVPQFSKYTISVTAVNFVPKTYIANITNKAFNVNFSMARQTTTLQGVVVTTKKPLIKQEDDKTIVDATVLANKHPVL